MSSSQRPVIRPKGRKVEDYALPRWDRYGNPVNPEKKPIKPTAVEEVAEEEIKLPTLEDLEAIREQAYNEGFEQGYESGMKEGHRVGEQAGHSEGQEKGYQEGLEKGSEAGRDQALKEEQSKTDQKLSVLDAATEALKNQLPMEQAELEQALLSLSVRIARQVIQDELTLEEKHIAQVVHAAVQSLPNPDDKLELSVNPEDYDVVSNLADSHWTVIKDESISAGGCQVKSGFSLIDYTLEHRFSNAVSHFLSELNRDDDERLSEPLSEETLMPPKDSEPEVDAPEESISDTDSESVTDNAAQAEDVEQFESGSDVDNTDPSEPAEEHTQAETPEPSQSTEGGPSSPAEQEEELIDHLLKESSDDSDLEPTGVPNPDQPEESSVSENDRQSEVEDESDTPE